MSQEKISPEFVIAVICDEYHQQLQYDPEAEPNIDIKFSTTISEWRIACDLLGWRGLGRALDKEWDIGASDSQWKELLEPADKRSLGDLCKFIATTTKKKRDVAQPIVLLGSSCLTASTFFAIRYYLARAGADVSNLRPTSLVGPYISNHLEVFLGPIAQLAPEKLPLVEIDASLQDIFMGIALLGMLLMVIGGTLTIALRDLALLILLIGVAMVGCGILGSFLAYFFHPKIKLTGIMTFSELVYALDKQDN